MSPLTNTETADPSVAGLAGEFREPSAFRANTTGPNEGTGACAVSTNRLGLEKGKGSWRGAALAPLTVNCIVAKYWPESTSGAAKLIWVEEAYSNGADKEPRFTLTPASFVVE